MKIQVLLDKNNYIEFYAEIGGLQGSAEIEVPNTLIDRLETRETTWNGNSFTQGKIIGIKESLKKEFKLNYRFYKLDNDTLIFDENKKTEEENNKLEAKKEELRQQIKQLDSDIEYYKTQNWDITNLENKKQDLLTRLNSL